MAESEAIKTALELGDRRAADVPAFRAAQLGRREAVLQRARLDQTELASVTAATPEFVAAAGSVARGTLVAEGDSWFDYPMTDVLRILEVDLRGTLSNAPAFYTDFWASELHPTPRGFELVAARLVQAL